MPSRVSHYLAAIRRAPSASQAILNAYGFPWVEGTLALLLLLEASNALLTRIVLG